MLGGGAEEDYQRQIRAIDREQKIKEEARARYVKSAEYNIGETTALGFRAGVFTDIGVIYASFGDITFKKLTPRLTLAGAVVGTALYAYKNLLIKTRDDTANSQSASKVKAKNV